MSLFCPNCKYHNRDNTLFCNLCGIKLLHLQTDSKSNKKDNQPESNFLSEIKRAVAEFLGDLAPSRLQKTIQRKRTASKFVEGINASDRELITSGEQTAAEFVEDTNSVNDISSTLPSNADETTRALNVDESVIDVTGSYAPISYDSTNENDLTQYDQVPKWDHMYVYSQTDIEYATDSQRKFYNAFRDSFLKGTYLDIEGNSNYAFILLFDLLEDYESHQDLSLLESQYEKLKLICPKTESYCSTLLTDLMESMGDHIGAERIKTQYYKDRGAYFGNDHRTLGKKYEKELKPSKNEAAERSLNAISIFRWKEEFKKITDDFNSSGLSSFVDRICSLAELNDQNPSSKNIYFEASKYLAKKDRLASIEMYLRYLHLDLHSTIENKQHTKKTKEALFSTNEQLHEFQKIVSELMADKDLKTALDAVPRIYAARKKIELDQSKIQKAQAEQTKTVNMLNELENESINEYTKIKENDHREFEIENIPKGRRDLDAVPGIYAARKKIELDQSKIQKAQAEQTKTVNMLNELENEFISEDLRIKENGHEEPKIKNVPESMNSNSVTISPSIALDPVHIEMLELFEKSAPESSTHNEYFEVSARDLDKFAESNEMFKNQLIDQINDICSELLDDEVLIEEDGENFVIYKPYCEKIYERMNNNER